MTEEPPPGWEIPDMYTKGRYDVGLLIDVQPYMPVFWSIDIGIMKVIEAVTELLIMKELHPDEFAGNVIIRPTTRSDSPLMFNGRECEEDRDDNSSRRYGHLQSVGGDRTSSADGTSYGFNRLEKAVKEQNKQQIEDEHIRLFGHPMSDCLPPTRSDPIARKNKVVLQQLLRSSEDIQGDCCSHRASDHSRVSPFECLICSCTKWDSGE